METYGVGAAALAVVGHGEGQVVEELVDHLGVAREDHHVESSLLAVEVPAAVVHHVADGLDVVLIGAELEHREVGGGAEPEAVDGLDALGEASGGVAHDLGEVHLPLRVTDAVPPGVVCSLKGAWMRTSDNGQTVSALAPAHHADLAGGACYNDARVEVTAA